MSGEKCMEYSSSKVCLMLLITCGFFMLKEEKEWWFFKPVDMQMIFLNKLLCDTGN